MRIEFPQDFLWGAATASYQVEGAVEEGGRTPSIWDTFCDKEGTIANGDDGSVASDQYHRYPQDISIMHELGIQAYRFSLSWPRIIPAGVGEVNDEAIVHYRNLMEALQEKGIKVVATLYHWDLPQTLEDAGGWRNRGTVHAFADYASVCFSKFGDLVDMWITINEPWCIAYLGHLTGEHAPGHTDWEETLRVVHHVNLAHGKAVQAYRTLIDKNAIGISWNLFIPRNATRRKEDIEAMDRAISIETRVFTDPVLHGTYPKELVEDERWNFPIVEGDMGIISQPIDFIGINYYNETVVTASDKDWRGYGKVPQWQETTSQQWPVTPEALMRLLSWINDESHGLPLYITENGCASDDIVENDRVHDHFRIQYLARHLEICEKAIRRQLPLKGYFVWSLIDNFEWAWGYGKRFGIIYCEYGTQKRIIKDSGYFLRDVISGYAEY